LLVLVRGEAFGLDASGKAWFGIRNAEQQKQAKPITQQLKI
jgi:hypothetical protein